MQNTQIVETAVKLAELPIKKRVTLVTNALLRYREGEHIFQIAKDLGVSRAGLYRHIMAVAPNEWKEAKVARAMDDVEQAEEALRTPLQTQSETTRAREQHRAATWMLERLKRDQFSQDHANGSGERVSITLNIGPGAAQSAQDTTQVIDVEQSSD